MFLMLGAVPRSIAVSLALLLGVRGAAAQGTIAGRVTDSAGAPLGGAEVVIRELASYRATTAADGGYTITIPQPRANGGSVTLIARAPGRFSSTRAITLGSGRQVADFVLADDPFGRDALVGTGGAEPAPARDLPFVIGAVSHEQLAQVPATTAAAGGMEGRVSGVQLIQPSGDPASAPSIRLRGATSIALRQDPMLIVDGTITRGSIADLSSEDIDRIEVAKGPVASAVYGSDAAAGVVQIFTRRGRDLADGALSVTVRNEVGSSFVSKRIPTSGAHDFQVTTSGGQVAFVRDTAGNRVLEPDRIADNPYPRYFDHQSELLDPGLFFTNHLAVAGRRGPTNFRVSFENTHSDGVVALVDGYRRQNVRLNVDQRLGRRVDLELSGLYGHSNDDRTSEGVTSPFFSLSFLEPYVDLLASNPDGSPYAARIPDNELNASNPLYNLANEKRATDRSRYIGGAVLRWRPLDWLTAEGNYNGDREGSDDSDRIPAGYLNNLGNPTPGFVSIETFRGRSYNTGGAVTATGRRGELEATAQAGYLYEHRTIRDSSANGQGDPPTVVGISTSFSEASAHDAFGIVSLALKRKYILDGAVRRDHLSSILGPEAGANWYYRLAGAWRAKEDLGIRGLDELTLHAGYGTAGVRFDRAFERPDFPLSTPVAGASPDLRPEHSGELELGANLSSARGRFTVEYAYSRKKTDDQLTVLNFPPSVGPPIPLLSNIGTLRSTTHELTLGARLVERGGLGWTLKITGDHTRQTISDYPLPERLAGADEQPRAFFVGQGVPLGVMYGNRLVRTINELYDDPAKAACRNTTCGPDTWVINEEGYVVAKASWRCGEDLVYHDTRTACTSPERPIMYVTCRTRNADGSCAATTSIVKIGDASPDFRVGVDTRFRLGRVSVSGLVDWSQGGNIYNGTRQWSFIAARDPVFDQRGKPDPEKKSELYYSAFYNLLSPEALFVEPATYVKIRELAVDYTLGPEQLRRVGLRGVQRMRLGLAGRNLFTFTKYSGYDPDASSVTGDPFQFRMDWFAYPQYRTVTGIVEIAF